MSYSWDADLPRQPIPPLSPAEEAFLRALGDPTSPQGLAQATPTPAPQRTPPPERPITGVIRRRRSDPGSARGR
jgi:hypothetical protein